jgi:hypothetical protein
MKGNNWWRYSEYIIDDSKLKPAADAESEPYDPWQGYFEWREDWKGNSPPYMEFIKLIFDKEVEDNIIESINEYMEIGEIETSLSSYTIDQILDWSKRNGMLGILPHQLQAIYFKPKDSVSFGYNRTGDGWNRAYTQVKKASSSTDNILRINLQPFNFDGDGFKEQFDKGGVGCLEDFMENLDAQIPDEDNLLFPLPLSDEFWSFYNEPLIDFFHVLNIFVSTVRAVAKDKHCDSNTLRIFNDFAGSVSTRVFKNDDGQWEQEIWSPSLLASYAYMISKDMQGSQKERRIYVCKDCDEICTSGSYQAAFCSDKCRLRYNKREYRKKKRVEELYCNQKLSLSQIAKKMREKDLTNIRRWLKAIKE